MSASRLKGKIKPPRKINGASNFDEAWELLSSAIHEVHRRNASVLSYEQLYRNAYNLVLSKNAERLYNSVKELVKKQLQDVTETHILPTATGLRGAGGQAGVDGQGLRFLKALKDSWEDHTLCMGMVGDIMLYLDRVYTKTANVPQIYDAGCHIFRDVVIRNNQVHSSLISTIVNLVRAERDGDVIDRSLVKSIIDMLGTLEAGGAIPANGAGNVYESDLEPKLLEKTRTYYINEARTLLPTYSAPQYLALVDRRLREENERCTTYIPASSASKLTRVVDGTMIEAHMKAVIEVGTGISWMLEHDKIEDLGRAWRLFQRVDTDVNALKTAVSEHVIAAGKEINNAVAAGVNSVEEGAEGESTVKEKVSATSLALKWVEDVVRLKGKYDTIWHGAFGSEDTMEKTISQSFEHFIALHPQAPEYISLFIDDNLKRGLKGKTETEVETVLDRTITLFRYLKDKDVFEKYYKGHLAKRLLWGRTVSDDAERGMIAKMKMEMGYNFTNKLEGMFKDMRLSAEVVDEYKKHMEGQERAIEMTPQILTSTHWPPVVARETQDTCIYPPEVEKARLSFQAFYLSRHNGRKLAWCPHLGTADIRAVFTNKRHELNVSTYAMVILLQFNNVPQSGSLSFQDIQQATSISAGELVRNLQSLACAKYKILTKEPKGRNVSPTDRFFFNESFSAPMTRIKVPTIAASNKVENDAERRETMKKLDDERKHEVEAAIVRIMKSRKTMDHNNLVAEVTKQLSTRFSPSPNMIKQRIEGLIERDYLERKEGDHRVYNYLA
ncbi:hypothetical protein G7K_3845-t1 [Saitoella complicata NRRL Y-17804]|uniref:Cullin family profile domain-containing protein n=2 Tax=Saitoella complicata (strain BCRC 22490 / CBS 7301 / JCM 7358 / NBRC 10748 / NRRL Y-17804) TaxID=698492 RepID=A0A0E9NIM8_SAICN|nr:hypothetical protein G7K_3845-t1 [Saitoella complicata NRRL Y-17804]